MEGSLGLLPPTPHAGDVSPAYDAIFFDFDGVLVDSEPVHYRCWLELFAPLGISLDWTTYQAKCIGTSDRDMLARMAAEAEEGVDVAALLNSYPAKRALFLSEMLRTMPFFAGVRELFAGLGGYKLAVVTSSGRNEVEPLLEKAGITHFLTAAVYGSDVEHPKPAPDAYLRARELTGATKPLVIEDSDAGMASAAAAGFDTLRVTHPAEVAEALRLRLAGRGR